jgi:hypothetical protein
MHCAFKILLPELLQALVYMGPECLTDIEVLAGDLNLHGYRKSFFAIPHYKTWAREMLTSTILKIFPGGNQSLSCYTSQHPTRPLNGAETSRVMA